MKILTVFTPTYNRAHLLSRLYKSLCEQTCQDFVWLVIDDGSKDTTRELVQLWIAEGKIDIQYVYQENQGMHSAHNTAYENMDTELNTCIDSDDYMPNNSVELILAKWNSIEKTKFAGIVGLDGIHNKEGILGTRFTSQSTTLEHFYRLGGKGDKKLVYRTDVVKNYPPYPIFEGEKYVGLGYKYLLIDKDYELVTLNEKLVIVDYQETGSSNNMLRQYIKNPKGFAFIRRESMKHSASQQRIFIEAIHYVSTSIILKDVHFVSKSPKKLITLFAIPFGVLLYAYIKFKTTLFKQH